MRGDIVVLAVVGRVPGRAIQTPLVPAQNWPFVFDALHPMCAYECTKVLHKRRRSIEQAEAIFVHRHKEEIL